LGIAADRVSAEIEKMLDGRDAAKNPKKMIERSARPQWQPKGAAALAALTRDHAVSPMDEDQESPTARRGTITGRGVRFLRRQRQRVRILSGAPRSMKMGTILSPYPKMPQLATRLNRQRCDTLRLCTTPRGRLPSRFYRRSGLPLNSGPLDERRDRRYGPIGDIAPFPKSSHR
jgi:hypothetical protein